MEKLSWLSLKTAIRKDLRSRDLKSPQLRLNALNNIEDILKAHFNNLCNNPVQILNYDKKDFCKKLSVYKSNGKLNSAEKSVINNIYEHLKKNSFGELNEVKPENDVVNEEANNIKSNSSNNSNIQLEILKYNNELIILQVLFGIKEVEEKLARLNEIFIKTEEYWEKQIENLPEEGIKYLLIAEAPPWSGEGEVTYVYNPKSKPRTLLKALSKAFNIPLSTPSTENTLKNLTKRGLLIIDSLPFAMDYGTKRSNYKYNQLISLTSNSYMLDKINRYDLSWFENVKVAFAFKRNGLAIIEALKNELSISKLDKTIKIDENLIVANKAGYPDGNLIKKVFSL